MRWIGNRDARQAGFAVRTSASLECLQSAVRSSSNLSGTNTPFEVLLRRRHDRCVVDGITLRAASSQQKERVRKNMPMNSQSLKFDTRLNQALAPRLQYAVRLLQLSALDYEQELQQLASKNPFLELDDPVLPTGSTGAADPGVDTVDSLGPAAPLDHDQLVASDPMGDGDVCTESGTESDNDSGLGEGDEADNSWASDSGGIRDGAKQSQGSALDLLACNTDLRQHLRGQANLLRLSVRDHALVCAVIESLDDDGYLRVQADEIEALSELEPPAEPTEIGTAVKLVQSLDPAGVGARSVGECLLLQLENIDAELRPLGLAILTDHIDRLAQRDVPALARLLDRPGQDIEAVCAALRRLDPRPGLRFASGDVHYLTPDVIVRKVRGKWAAQLNAVGVPRLRLNHRYALLFQRHQDARHTEMSTHLQEARWALRNVEQRCSTILAVAQAILRRQYGFFEHGPLAMKPLALRDIATEIGVHESTVCRVTNNKYMSTPAGLFELKQFFSRPMAMSGGGACSPTAIRGVLRALVDAEDVSCPLSDVDIAQRLERQGLKVARRTVTKYRQMLSIAPADRRRTFAGVAP